jgi:hypothetical protein
MNVSRFARYFTRLVSVGVEGGNSESGAGSREGIESQIAHCVGLIKGESGRRGVRVYQWHGTG